VIGSTVNFPSRLEGEAKKDNIIVSAEIKEKVQNGFVEIMLLIYSVKAF
jgi:class 3 adenylate cyclase